MNKQQLAKRIWASANKMRSKIEANEYKDYILGFIFYKFLSDKEVQFLKSKGIKEEMLPTITEDKENRVKFIQENLGYFIAYENLFSTWLGMDRDFTVANVRDALSAFNRLIHPNHKKLFDKIFDTLQTGLSKLGASTAEQNQAVRDLVALIKDIPTDGRQDYDVLGFVYEYLISNFAANAGKKAGEFYTPHEVSVMMSDIIAYHLRGNDEIRIYDPTSGSGSLLINIGKSVARHIANKDNIKYYAQELKQNTYNLTRMNLIMRGIRPSNIEARNGDTLKEDWPYFDESDPQGTYDPLYVDAVVSNPPYSQEWDPTDQENDPRYADFGLAPKSKADLAFLLHDLYHVKPEGIMTIVLPHGVLYRGEELQIRTNLVEKNHIDAIIGLPEKVFFGTGISTIVMVLKRAKTRPDTNILFVDASRGFEKAGKNNKLRECDIRKIVDVVTERKEIADFSRLVSRDTIRQNEYNLNISRYVDSSDKPEQYDIYSTMFGGIPRSEIEQLSDYWQAFPSLMDDLFTFNEHGFAQLNANPNFSIADYIRTNKDVQHFYECYNTAFADHHDYLYRNLVQAMFECNIQQKHSELTADIFRRVTPFSLVDKYQAFQFFSNDWKRIQTDLEIIQTEGAEAFQEIEVDEETGNEDGKLIPFDIVQQELLPSLVMEIENREDRLTQIAERYAEILATLTPDELDKTIVNDDNTKFVATEVKKEVKRILDAVVTDDIELLRNFPKGKTEKEQFIKANPQMPWDKVEKDKSGNYGKTQINKMITILREQFEFAEDSFEAKLKEVYTLQQEEKRISDELKDKRADLLEKTREHIKSMGLDTATHLIDIKWTTPLINSLSRLPEEVIQSLADKVQHLADKYATTYQDIANRIQSAESRLYDLLGELQGNQADTLGLNQFRQTLNTTH